jgi:CDP-diacylglycerol--glycerol-3-phosphate 3-phosphatidyltransferase
MGVRARSPAAGRADPVLTRLRRICCILGGAGLLLLAGGACLLAAVWGQAAAVRWSVQAGAVMVVVLIRLEASLELNRHPSGTRLLTSLGAANTLTLARAALTAVMAGFLFQDLPGDGQGAWLRWAPGSLYLLAVIMDYADGWIARATGTETRLGEFLDTEVDALGLLVACLLLVTCGKAPTAFLSVGIGYYGIRAAARIRSWSGRRIGEVAPRADARMVAGSAMGYAAAALLPVLSSEATTLAAWVMATVFLSGMIKDWLIICGHASPEGRFRGERTRAIETAIARTLPIFLRVAVAGGVLLFISEPCPAGGGAAWAGVLILGTLCTLGVAARAAGMILSCIMAGFVTATCNGPGAGLTLTASVFLMMTGAGHPRIWQPEDAFFLKKRG